MRRLALLVAAAAVACSDDGGRPPVGSLDGNVIVWDGSPVVSDIGGPDAGPSPDAEDAGVGPHDGAGSEDALPPDDGGVDPCGEAPSATVTATQAASDASLIGQVIEARGVLTPSALRCVGGPCSDEAPCCETCAASMALDEVLALSTSECRDALVGCGGSNCATTCSPPVFGGPIGVVGRLVAGDDGAVLEVWELRR